MIRICRFSFVFIFILIAGFSWAQKVSPEESRFKNARELMDLGKFGMAMQAFEPLTASFEGNRYTIISSFYYAVSAYNEGQKYVARDMFLQILQKYPKWEKLDEVNLWLANIYLEDGDFMNGLSYASFIRNNEIKQQALEIKSNYLKVLTFNELDSLLQTYPSDIAIASSLADKIIEMTIDEQDRDYLENIVSVFELDKSKYRVDEELKSIKKDRYNVAIILPFMMDELNENSRHISNEFVIELYEGFLVGVTDLRNKGINIATHLYDTKKDSSITSQIVQLEELKHMDLIIGPLYSGPVKVVSDFAFDYQINMINPLSSNSDITGNNPYAFLFMPSIETVAKKSADYISATLENKNAFIFHGTNQRDSTLAYEYKKEIESRGFVVSYIEGIEKENSKKILDVLTNTITIEFDASEFDSLIIEDEIVGNLRITEKDYLVIQPDSIGHVFIASERLSLIASAITGLETRGDTITLLGSETWLEHREISLGGLNRLNTFLIAPTFVDKTKTKFEGINNIYIETFNGYPSRNFYIGYEVMMSTGKLMGKLGNLFQYDPGINDFIPGEIFSGILYGSENNNQIVPILKYEHSELIIVNPR